MFVSVTARQYSATGSCSQDRSRERYGRREQLDITCAKTLVETYENQKDQTRCHKEGTMGCFRTGRIQLSFPASARESTAAGKVYGHPLVSS